MSFTQSLSGLGAVPGVTGSHNYDPRSSYCVTMLRLGRSVAPKVLLQKDFWLLLCIHCFTFAYYNNGYMGQKDTGWRLSTLELEWSDVELMFILMSCALCFAVHQAYCRYLFLGDLVWKMMDSIYDFAFEARLLLRAEHQPFDRLGCRWVVGSMALVLCEVKKASKGKTVGQSDILKMVDLELMRPGEADFLEELGTRQRTLVMMHTASDCTFHGLQQNNVAPAMTREVMQRLMKCKSYQLQLLDNANSMLPFQYIHLLSVLTVFVSCILGVCMGICDSWMAPPAYAATLLIILGLFELLSSLSNPFDSSLEADFPVQSWVADFLSNLTVLLNYEHRNDQWKSELQDEVDNPVHFPLTVEQVSDILSGEVQRFKTNRAKAPAGYSALRAQADPEGPSWLRSVRFEEPEAEEKSTENSRGWLGALGEAFGITTSEREARSLEA
ncbi:Uncharacterized protein SCF082_LOCUS16866 [Durusdinium trenchii]|uniref:Bestrophin homolog n=1 Tax=Durusdinium trenchii TaxID=1381693 RepID=A0ABP0KDV8_9DINO